VFALRSMNFTVQVSENCPSVPYQGKSIVVGFVTHLFAGIHQSVFEPQNAFPGPQTGFQLFWMAWFGQVIVRARFQTGDEILLGSF
jgi:hypothetical protein